MLKNAKPKIYKVKAGQTLSSLARAIGVTEYLLAAENGLKEELFEGQILILPQSGNLYTVQAGDTKTLLCGGEERYEARNGVDIFYPGMKILL